MVRTKVLVKYKTHIRGLASKLEARCRTHAHLVEAEDIQDVVDLLAEFIDDVDERLIALDSTEGRTISYLQSHRLFARKVRSHCFSMLESFNRSKRRAKPPEFYDLLSELPRQLYDLARRL